MIGIALIAAAVGAAPPQQPVELTRRDCDPVPMRAGLPLAPRGSPVAPVRKRPCGPVQI